MKIQNVGRNWTSDSHEGCIWSNSSNVKYDFIRTGLLENIDFVRRGHLVDEKRINILTEVRGDFLKVLIFILGWM